MKFLSSLLILFSLTTCHPVYATFMEPNDLWVEDNVDSLAGIDLQTLEDLEQEIVDVYTPILRQLGYNLNIENDWSNSEVNAYVGIYGKSIYMTILGGLARRPEMTRDSMSLVVCHELGHVLGGIPQYPGREASNEGNSDYYSTMSCTRNIWLGKGRGPNQTIDAYAKAQCDRQWYGENREVCYRSMGAAGQLARLLARGAQISYSTPDPSVVSVTQDKHPKGQCRLDTYMAGALCKKTWDNSVIPASVDDQQRTSCLLARSYLTGARPACWFKR